LNILSNILYKSGSVKIIGDTNINISDICFDSRKVSAGCLFVAVEGLTFDGHNFINQTIENGAAAIVCEKLPENLIQNITYVQVRDSSIALGQISSNFLDNPSSDLTLIGVTGTNGKTTIATLLHKLFISLGYNVGLLSTIENKIQHKVISATHTTPDAFQINSLLKQMVDNNCSHCFMEVSSHSLDQNRTAGLHFSGGVFTNLTHDHLDYHKTFSDYLKAKKKFFDMLPKTSFAISNIDDKNGLVMLQNTNAIKKTYSLKSVSDFKCRILENQFSGLFLDIDGDEMWCRLSGTFNAYNLLAVYSTALLLGEKRKEILTSISCLEPIEGRFEYVKSSNNITGIVDYAHTPDALENVLNTISDIRTRNEQVITVIGTGGDRDSAKRPIMAQVACEQSDKVILTSDNPRSEDPDEIINEMKKGVDAVSFKKVLSIVNRKEAIKTACAIARSGDIILLAGKGHEKYQEIKGVKHPFDDKAILKEILNSYTQ